MEDQDQKWLLDCLMATLDTSRDVRSFAEASLQQASLQPGFGAALAKVTVNKGIPFGLRQLAAVLLKQFIKQHWQEDEGTFLHPVVSAEEKGAIRQLLLPSLDDPHGKIRTAVGMAIASIAHYDWPEDWPELLPFLLQLISGQNNIDGVRGSLKCLALLSGDLDDTLVPKLVPALFPHLQTILSSPNSYEKSLRAKAVEIMHSCISVLGSMTGVYKTEVMAMMTPMLNSLLEHFSVILQPPVQPEDPDDWGIRMEVLKCLLQLVQNFPSLLKAQFSIIVAPLWQMVVSSLKVYQLAAIQGSEDPYSGTYDSDGAEKSLESFVIQLFELLLTIVGNSKFAKVFATRINELAYYTIAFLQITEEQVHTWSIDANRYVADEDDATYSCRVSGALLLEETVNAYDEEGISAILEAAQRHLFESNQSRSAGSLYWWKLYEAPLFALISISEQLLELQASSLGNLLDQILIEAMGTGVHEYPFLHARAFAAVASFSSVINQRICEQFTCAAIQALASDVPPPVKVGACSALAKLLPESSKEIVHPRMMSLLQSLTDLLKNASDETLHLVLETLQAAVKAGHELSASIEPILSPMILNVWVQHVSDPFISIDALEVLEAIKNAPGCMHSFILRVVPSIKSILEKPQLQSEGLVAGSLDLLTMILKNAPIDLVKAVFEICFHPTVQILLESHDHGEMQNATECLATFLSAGKQDLLGWGGDPGLTMKRLLDASYRLLDPDVESSGSLFVGSYMLVLILHLQAQMAPHIPELVAAIVRRMQSCEAAGLKSSLLVILARLVHLCSPNVDWFITLLLSVPAKGHDNALSYVMSEWTRQQGEIQGAYQIKLTTTALALLLSTRNLELGKINVQGYLIKSNTGITTRSKAKASPDQWTVIPLPAKIFALLSDTLVEIQEQALPGDDDDSDWEEVIYGSEISEAVYSATASSNARPSTEHLDAIAKVFNKGDGDDDDDDNDDLMKADPLNEINLIDYLRNFFLQFANSDKSLFEQLTQSLTPEQRKAVANVIS
ncbi:Importin-beta N-terminal domain-containing protein [Dioscorea alata]|uniref:Importin-beta N-terminal domain-containing protein n=1 Tax=Dioscorea alata TaxID=55571 RepID=A0ACB7VEJ3_DIOAL|nr:Importin-beta N-terminal domain-containing protein [Dioscorea alata]